MDSMQTLINQKRFAEAIGRCNDPRTLAALVHVILSDYGYFELHDMSYDEAAAEVRGDRDLGASLAPLLDQAARRWTMIVDMSE